VGNDTKVMVCGYVACLQISHQDRGSARDKIDPLRTSGANWPLNIPFVCD